MMMDELKKADKYYLYLINDKGNFEEKDCMGDGHELDGFNRDSLAKMTMAAGDLSGDAIKDLLAQVRFASIEIDSNMDPDRAAYKAAMESVAKARGVYEDEDREDAFLDHQQNVDPKNAGYV